MTPSTSPAYSQSVAGHGDLNDLIRGAAPLIQLEAHLDGVRSRRPTLVGRRRERRVLDELVAAVEAGEGRALVVRGDPGVGKTALLDHLMSNSGRCRVVSAAGFEAEMELPFAGLQQLCGPLLADLGEIPQVQGNALRTAFGLATGDAPDRFLIGIAVLSLLTHASQTRPLICVIDDLQWLDLASQQALAFVSRRLGDQPVGIVASSRIVRDQSKLRDLPELLVEGLTEGDASILLDSVLTSPLDSVARSTFIAETRGNPLAILELTRGLSPEQLAGGFGSTRDLTGRIEESFRRRLSAFPAETLLLLLIAAADRGNDPLLLWRVAETLEVDEEHAEPAVTAHYADLDGRIRFCHPLARSAAYRSASPEDRRMVHRTFAQIIDPAVDPDRRAWHRAQATRGLDEDVADELERSAGRAQARGGVAAAAAFLERAAELTPDPARRAQRALTAAQAKYLAGAPERALRLLAIAETSPPDQLVSARADLLRAKIDISSGFGWEGPLLRAAERLEVLDRELARETYRDAFFAALTSGRMTAHGGMQEVAKAVHRAKPTTGVESAAGDLILTGLARLVTDGYQAGAPVLQEALNAFRREELSDGEAIGWLPLACRVAHNVWDEVAYEELSDRLLQAARRRGALSVMPLALSLRLGCLMFLGEIETAAGLVDECETIARATASELRPYGQVWVGAWRGDTRIIGMIEAATQDMTQRREGQWVPAASFALAVLHNSLGHYDAALAAAELGSQFPDELGIATWCLIELVEAAVRSGSPERAAPAMRRLSEMVSACRSDWTLGVHARLSAMLEPGQAAEELYREAISRLGNTLVRTELARAHLVYGEWLRRQNRRIDSRQELRLALELFEEMELHGFADRARRELRATGETVRRRTPDAGVELTPQETQIARLAVNGQTNPEIGSQLFISPRTVEWHLRKVFTKVGVRSRKELRAAWRGIEASQ